MTQISKRTLRAGALFFTGIILLTVVGIEVFVRYWVIPRDFLYFKVERTRFPYFRLADHFASAGITIKNGRRELAPRGNRPRRIAFVGDSNTFGLGTMDADTFPEILQTLQTHWDTYNFGVPGYGIHEVKAMVKELAKNKYDVIAYNYNVNDAIVAMFLYLPLMGSADSRLTTMDAYEGSYGKLKLFAKDYLKSLFVFPALIRSTQGPRQIASTSNNPSPSAPMDCFQQLSQEAQIDGPLAKPYHVLTRIYSDPTVQFKLVQLLSEMNNEAKSGGARLVLFLHHDFQLMTRLPELNDLIVDIFRRSGVEFIDTKPLYSAHYKECNFYSDPPHLGAKGNEYVAKALATYLAR